MKIVIDVRNLQTWARYRGGGSYTRNLIRAISNIDRTNKYSLLVYEDARFADLGLEGLGDNFSLLPFSVPSVYKKNSWLFDETCLSAFLKKQALDLFHQPDPFKMLYAGTGGSFKTAVMVHDFVPLFYPPPFSLRAVVFKWVVHRLLRRIRAADHIFVNSENTQKDVVTLLGFPEERITVAYPALSFKPLPVPEDVRKAVKKKYGLNEVFVLFAGGLDERKNIGNLLRAFKKCRDGLSEDCRMVITGWDGKRISSPDCRKALRLIEELDLREQVVFTGFIPEEDLAALYASAAVFFFPSRYEGFGMVCLDAMSYGCPVVCARTSSLPEVVGEAGILVDPENTEEMAGALGKIMGDASFREQLRTASLKRAEKFSWEETARKTLDVYFRLFRK
ncbi:MAG: glycosyltransferase family 1 protein [bacterium]